MKKRKLIGGIAIACALLLFGSLAFVTVSTARGGAEVIVVNSPVAKGSVIQAGQLGKASMGKQNLPGNTVLRAEEVVGKYAAVDLVPGDLMLASKASGTPVTGDAQLSSLPSGKLAVSCAVPTLSSGVSNKLLPGDIIRVYQYKDGQTLLAAALTYVKILGVSTSDGQAVNDKKTDGGEQVAATVTVLADSAQVREIARIDHEGGIHIALISRGDQGLAEQLLKEQDAMNAKGGNV